MTITLDHYNLFIEMLITTEDKRIRFWFDAVTVDLDYILLELVFLMFLPKSVSKCAPSFTPSNIFH